MSRFAVFYDILYSYSIVYNQKQQRDGNNIVSTHTTKILYVCNTLHCCHI